MNVRDFDIGVIRPFDVNSDPNSVGSEWKRWLPRFQLYADGKGLILVPDKDDNKIQRRALLLHCAGPDVQDIFDVLPDTGGAKDSCPEIADISEPADYQRQSGKIKMAAETASIYHASLHNLSSVVLFDTGRKSGKDFQTLQLVKNVISGRIKYK